MDKEKNRNRDLLLEVAKHGLTMQVYALAALTIVLLLAVARLSDASLSSFFVGVISSLLASGIYSIISVRAQREIVRLTAAETSDIVAQKLDSLPRKTFPSGSRTDPGFEAHFMEQLRASHIYWFKGVSGVLTARRVQQLCQLNVLDASKETRLVMLNPSNTRLLTEHIRFRLHGSGWSNGDYALQVKNLQDDLLSVIVILHPYTRTHNIDVRFHDEFCVARGELFDSGLYLSYYRGGADYPGTEFYSRESKPFNAYQMAFASSFQDASLFSLAHLNNNTIEEILHNLNFPGSNIAVLRKRFESHARHLHQG